MFAWFLNKTMKFSKWRADVEQIIAAVTFKSTKMIRPDLLCMK